MPSLVAVVALGILTTIPNKTNHGNLLSPGGSGAVVGVEAAGLLAPLCMGVVNYKESLTNVDLEAAHVLAVELFLGIICIKLVIELNEGEGTLHT